MSAITGVFRLDGAPVAGSTVAAMIQRLGHRGPDASETWVDGALGLAHCALYTTPESRHERQPRVREGAGPVIVADARIDNRDELCALLSLDPSRSRADAELILHAYERWGRECVTHLYGDFAFAIWDPRHRILLCARDPMGVRPFYYHHSPRLFAFASEIKALFCVRGVPRAIDHEQIGPLLAAAQQDRTATLYEGIRRLPAGHTLAIRSDSCSIVEYWRPNADREVRFSTDEQYAEAFREIFARAVGDRLRTDAPVGATLSGGLDSSSIVCMARRLRGAQAGLPLHTFSLVFPDLPADDLRRIDERPYIESVLREGGVESHTVRGDQLSPLGGIEQILWHLDEPHGAPNLFLHWGLFSAAREQGVRVLLDGFDGDSAVGHGFGRLNGLLTQGRWDTFEREVRAFARCRPMPVTRVLDHFGLPFLADLARQRRWATWLRAAAQFSARFGLSRRHLALRYGLGGCAPEWVRDAWRRRRRVIGAPPLTEPIGSVRSKGAPEIRTERETHIEGISQPAYQATLELADRCARAHGIEPRYPFFDRRLIDFCLAVPDEQKFAEGWPRLLFRRAMQGILPPEVQWRSTKANLSPSFRRGLRSVDRLLIERTLAPRTPLGRYVDQRALETIARRYFAAAPGGPLESDGEMLFRATVLGVWLAGWSADEAAGAWTVASEEAA